MLKVATYGWVWSWDDYALDSENEAGMNRAEYPDCHDSKGYHWITVYSYGQEGVEDEICTLPLYTEYEQWRGLITDREEKAQMIVDALNRDLQEAGVSK